MQIDRLAHHETERLRTLRLRSLRDAPDAFESTYAQSAARPHDAWVQQLRDLVTFVAVVDGGDVGIVRGVRPGLTPGAPPDLAALISMWVAPESRGKGVGGALVDAVIDWARSEGFARLHLEVRDHNAPAIALYVRKGFARTGPSVPCAPPREHMSEHERTLELARAPQPRG